MKDSKIRIAQYDIRYTQYELGGLNSAEVKRKR